MHNSQYKKIISISLWGNNPRYCIGAIKNSKLAKEIYPDWEYRVYYDNTVPEGTINELMENGTNIILVKDSLLSGAFWRFFAAESEESIVICRDADSRLSQREKQCVDDWLNSDKKYSIIRDHVRHYDFPMLAGMWGVRGGLSEAKIKSIYHFETLYYYTVDQIYLSEYVWKEARYDCYISGIIETTQFKESRELVNVDFVGQGYDENENPIYPII